MENASTNSASTPEPNRPQGAPIPSSFMSYVKSMGPGIVLVLTWLGAGDIVSAATSGGNYGYALMWVFVLCLLFRYVFVSIVAKYQLCNETGASILGGLSKVKAILRVRLIDATGRAIRDFDWEDVRGDSVAHRVPWKSSFKTLGKEPVRIECELRDAQLFAFDLLD